MKIESKNYCSSRECKKENLYHFLRHWTVKKINPTSFDNPSIKFTKEVLKVLGLTASALLALPTLGLSAYIAYDFVQEQKRQDFIQKKITLKNSKSKSSKSKIQQRKKNETLPSQKEKGQFGKEARHNESNLPSSAIIPDMLLGLGMDSVSQSNLSGSLPVHPIFESLTSPLPVPTPSLSTKSVFCAEDFLKNQMTFSFVPGEALNALQVNPVDPLISADLSEEEEIILFKKHGLQIPFLTSTLINHVLVADENKIYIYIDDKYTDVVLWENKKEHEEFFSFLISSSIIEENEKSLILKKLKDLKETKSFIENFEKENEISFFYLMDTIRTLMSMKDCGGFGSQHHGIELLFQLYSNLKEPIRKTLFPRYPYNPGDPQCISSSSRILLNQIERIEKLGLIKLSKRITIEEIQKLNQENHQKLIDSLKPSLEWVKQQNNQIKESSSNLYEWPGYQAETLSGTFQGKAVTFKLVNLAEGGFFETLAASIYFYKMRFETSKADPFYSAIGVSENDNLQDFAFVGERIKNYMNEKKEEVKDLLPKMINSNSFNKANFSQKEKNMCKNYNYERSDPDNIAWIKERLYKYFEESPESLQKFLEDAGTVLTYLSSHFEGLIPNTCCIKESSRIKISDVCPIVLPLIFQNTDGSHALVIDRSDIY